MYGSRVYDFFRCSHEMCCHGDDRQNRRRPNSLSLSLTIVILPPLIKFSPGGAHGVFPSLTFHACASYAGTRYNTYIIQVAKHALRKSI